MVSEGSGAESNSNHESCSSDAEITRLVNERLGKDPSFNDKGLAERIMNLGPLGLRLNATHELVKSMEMGLNMKQRSGGGAESDHGGAAEGRRWEKLKASNFPAELLVIGSWRVVSMNDGDLVAKCYFAKRKLVWEVLETTQKLKRKIEVQWSDISAIRATFGPNQPGILEVELSQPPTFFQELNPQPKKHTIWSTTKDFTDGQALLHRRHYLRFPAGSLDKQYEKILQADPRLMKLSQQQFPSHPCPCFTDPSRLAFSLDFGGYKPAWPSYCPNQPYLQGLSMSPDSDYLPIEDGAITRFDQNQNHWDSFSDFGTKNQMQVQQQPMVADMSTHVYQNQDYQLATYDESLRQFCPNPSTRMLGSSEAQLNWSTLASISSNQFESIGGIYPQIVDSVTPQASNDFYQLSGFYRNNSVSNLCLSQDQWMEDCAGESANNMWTAEFHTANV